MKATLLSIGDELLIGQTVNTNVSWMAQRLNGIGIDVYHMITVADDEKDMLEQLDIAVKESDIVLITGGLGPTSDDITRDTLCKYFKSELVFNQQVLDNIEKIFALRQRELTSETKDLSMVPHNAVTIYNSQGTAPGMLFHHGGKVVASMPGVPYEMKAMMNDTVIPFLETHFSLPFIMHRYILTAGVGETQLAAKLVDFEKNIPENVSLGYYPSIGRVKVRVTVHEQDKDIASEKIKHYANLVYEAIKEYVYGFDDETLEGNIGKILKEHDLKTGFAESCTGGFLSHLITQIPGSSAYFNGSVVSYANETKMNVLGVKEETLQSFGAVSEQTVSEMLQGALKVLNVDIAVAISGVAGPDGGSPEKPVGTVVIGIANKEKEYIRRLSFTTDRMKNIEISATVALVMLRKFLLTNLRG